jgi:formyltetrahydrofolate deformylase
VDSSQFGDRARHWFFLRTSFDLRRDQKIEVLERAFLPIARDFGMDAHFFDAAHRTRTLIMVSKFGHCLVDLLYRVRIGALPIEVPVVVSNHRDFSDVAAAHEIPFRFLPVTPDNRGEQEAMLQEILAAKGIDLIVLARYMQVLSPEFSSAWSGKIINIHHSFLPSFKGAKPYHQAHARGVKLVGATAHYVTCDLDEGPIIEQEVDRVTHSMSAGEFASLGRDIESRVLARAVKWHAEHRLLLDGNRTVVFS